MDFVNKLSGGNSQGQGQGTTAGITRNEIDAVRSAAKSAYGIDLGDTVAGGSELSSREQMFKVDWNINDNHRLSLRLSETEQAVSIFPNATSTTRISLNSQAYSQVKNFESQVAQLYSNWTDNLTTEFKVSHRDYESG